MENNSIDKKNESVSYWDTFKTESVKFLDRRKHNTFENIRLAIIVLGIVFIIGVFCPLLGATMKFSMIDTSQGDKASETVIFEPKEDIIKFSAGDLIFHQPLREFELFGKELGDMQILGINIYDTLTTPMPNYDNLKQAKKSLQSGPITVLTEPWFVDFCNENLGDFGKKVVEVGASISEIADVLGGALGEITGVLDEVKVVSDDVRADIQAAENAVNTVETCIAIVFALIVAMMLYVILWRKPNYIIPSVLAFFSLGFIAIEVVVIIINVKLHDAITAGMNEVSASMGDMVDKIMPGLSDLLAQFTSADTINFIFTGTLYTGSGWWISTIALVAITILAFVQTKKFLKNKLQEQEQQAV